MKRMAGTTGLEPATSAVTVLCRRKYLRTPNESERHLGTVFMELWPHSLLSTCTRATLSKLVERRAGMAGLRHKSRHKIGCPPELSGDNSPGRIWMHPSVPNSEKIKNGSELVRSNLTRRSAGRSIPIESLSAPKLDKLLSRTSRSAAEVCGHLESPLSKQPFRDVVSVSVLLAPSAQPG